MNRDMQRKMRKVEAVFGHSPRREADGYYTEHRDGQPVEEFRQHVAARLRHLRTGRRAFAAIAFTGLAGMAMAVGNEDTETAVLLALPTAAFGALAVRNQRRIMFWNWIDGHAAQNPAEAEQRLRAAQRGEYDRTRPMA